jgi:hypothetical protein
MHIVQRDGERTLDTEIVYYDGSEPLLPGYAVCYDMAAPLVEAAGEFAENIRGRRVMKPATANLEHFAGIVITPPQKRMGIASNNKGFCVIARLRRGDFIKARVVGNLTAGVTYLSPADGVWNLAVGSIGTIAAARLVVGIAAETNASAVIGTPTLIMGSNG